MRFSRRELILGATAAAPLLLAAKGVRMRPIALGVQTYSFRDMLPQPGDMVDKMIAGMRALDLDTIELFEPTIQPPEFSAMAPWRVDLSGQPTQASVFGRPPEGPPSQQELDTRAKIRAWRTETPIAHFETIGRRFRKAGIRVQGFNFGLKEDCTDAEVERGFAITRALGTDLLTASTTLKMAARAVPFATRHHVRVGLHGHSNLHDPNQFATPESFEKGLAMSPLYWMNLDIGHFSAGGFDTLPYIEKYHARICSVHLKDRKAHDGANVPFGEGDTPIAEAVRLIRDRHYPIPAMLEYEYPGGASVPALARCRDFVDAALAKA